MRQARSRRPVTLVGTAIWMVVWGAGIILACVALVAALRAARWEAVPFLLAWIGFAGFALWRVGRDAFRRLAGEGPEPRRPARARRRWQDAMPEGDGS